MARWTPRYRQSSRLYDEPKKQAQKKAHNTKDRNQKKPPGPSLLSKKNLSRPPVEPYGLVLLVAVVGCNVVMNEGK